MRKEKETALKLRLSGKSYTEINRILSIPKSTLSGWFSNIVLSKEIRDKINRRTQKKSLESLLRRNKQQTEFAIKKANKIKVQASKEISNLSKNDLLILGAALYWAEGYKRPIIRNGREITHHVVSMTNSDPFLIKIFLKFLREYCKVPENKIKGSIRIFNHQNENELKRFWQKETKILPENFNKVYYGISKSSQGKRPFNRLQYGVIQIVVANTELYHKIMGYIEGLKKLV